MGALQITDEQGNQYWVAHTESNEIAVIDHDTELVLWVDKDIALSNSEVSPLPFEVAEDADFAAYQEERITMVRDPENDTEHAFAYKSILDLGKQRWAPKNQHGEILCRDPLTTRMMKQGHAWGEVTHTLKDDASPIGVVLKTSPASAKRLSIKYRTD